MKLEEAVGKVEELIESEVPPKTSEQESAKEEDGSVELESQFLEDALLVDGTEKGLFGVSASTEGDKPTTGRVYERDSSNHCMLSTSSTGHLADSHTLSSAEENEPSQAETAVEGDPSGVSGATVGRKSHRS
eukprot:bmy_05085T0